MVTCKLMIVDDDEDIRESLVDLLQTEGYEALGVASGATALSQLTWEQFIPDVIVLDLLMPQMGGDQLRTVLQRHPRWSRIPIILCTGDLVPDAVRTAVFGVLQKPFDLERLFAMVKSACGCEL
jgi:CheY-like chemotaxis protein